MSSYIIDFHTRESLIKMDQEQYANYDHEGGYDPKQRPPPKTHQVRPQVDPDAEGEVDPNL